MSYADALDSGDVGLGWTTGATIARAAVDGSTDGELPKDRVTPDTVRVRTRDRTGCVAPEIRGHLIEHLGRCVCGGLWVGESDRVETDDDVRADTLSVLADLIAVSHSRLDHRT